jgi:hypothetical protein
MHFTTVAMAVFAALVVTMASPTAQAQQRGARRIVAENGWLTDYAAACELARRQDRPLFVVLRCVP